MRGYIAYGARAEDNEARRYATVRKRVLHALLAIGWRLGAI